MTETRTVVARAAAFTGQGVRDHFFFVGSDGTVRVWDSIAGHYTTCHRMSARTLCRIRKIGEDR